MLITLITVFLLLKDLIDKKNNSSDKTNKNIDASKMSALANNSSENITSNIMQFVASEKQQCLPIAHPNVTIVGSSGNHDHGSSKVKLKNIVDYKWEVKNYPGHLIAMHIDGKHIAYVINVHNRVSGTEGMVRVTNALTGQRSLIKGMSGEVLDLQFAHIENDRILACIDASSLYIYRIEESGGNLICNFLLKIEDPLENYTPKYDKISWCPYIPEDCPSDDDDDLSHLIAWSRYNMFQCFNVSSILKLHKGSKVNVELIKASCLRFSRDSLAITWIGLSPDGTTLAIGSESGIIRFYQVYFYQSEPRCLHQWEPHNGKPISSFFFLDNLTKPSADPYWKYALTGADDNTELKVWDCGTWTCLQTIKINAFDNRKIKFIAEIDRTASYLVLTNIETRSLYVLQVNANQSVICSDNSDERPQQLINNSNRILVRSISEFPLSSSVLSFSIIDAAVRKYKSALNDHFFAEEFDDYDEENNAVYCVVLRMFIVQPKSVQECHILYQPTVDTNCDVKSTISIEKEDLSDSELSSKSSNSPKSNKIMISSNTDLKKLLETSTGNMEKLDNRTQLNQVLMTPAFFTASGKKTPVNVSPEVISLMLAGIKFSAGSNATVNNSTSLKNLHLVDNKHIEDQAQQKQKNFISIDSNEVRNTEHLTSGGSSPSREVQEIMSLQEFETGNDVGIKENDIETSEEIVERINTTDTDNATGSVKQEEVDASKSSDWPKVPDVTTVSRQSTECLNSVNLIPHPNVELTEINFKMSQLLDLVKIQSTQISALTDEVSQLKISKSESKKQIIDASYKLEKRLSKMLEEYLKRYEREHKEKLESFLEVSDSRHRQILDSVVEMLTNFLEAKMSDRISNAIIMQLHQNLIPNIMAKIDSAQNFIQQDVSNRLVVNARVLKDHISQVCKSQGVIESFGKSVLEGVQGSLQAVFIESMSTSLIPAYEKSSQNMFRQLHEAFSVGIKEFMEQFNNYLLQMQPVQDSNVEILNKFLTFKEHLDSTLVKHKACVAESILDTKKDIKNLELNMTRHLTDIMKMEIRQGFESQAASLEDSVLSVVRSQAHTPAPSIYDVQDQIKNLLNQGQVNKAFHQALLANDLSLVDYTLNKADYNTVFNPCCLDQTVLLSLIQQISADMNNHNDIKQKYLTDAIFNLNPNDIITKEHSPKVMYDLLRNCQTYLESHPKSPLSSTVRMTMMVIQGMGHKAY